MNTCPFAFSWFMTDTFWWCFLINFKWTLKLSLKICYMICLLYFKCPGFRNRHLQSDSSYSKNILSVRRKGNKDLKYSWLKYELRKYIIRLWLTHEMMVWGQSGNINMKRSWEKVVAVTTTTSTTTTSTTAKNIN